MRSAARGRPARARGVAAARPAVAGRTRRLAGRPTAMPSAQGRKASSAAVGTPAAQGLQRTWNVGERPVEPWWSLVSPSMGHSRRASSRRSRLPPISRWLVVAVATRLATPSRSASASTSLCQGAPTSTGTALQRRAAPAPAVSRGSCRGRCGAARDGEDEPAAGRGASRLVLAIRPGGYAPRWRQARPGSAGSPRCVRSCPIRRARAGAWRTDCAS